MKPIEQLAARTGDQVEKVEAALRATADDLRAAADRLERSREALADTRGQGALIRLEATRQLALLAGRSVRPISEDAAQMIVAGTILEDIAREADEILLTEARPSAG